MAVWAPNIHLEKEAFQEKKKKKDAGRAGRKVGLLEEIYFFIFPICIGPKLTLVTAVARWGINVLFLFCWVGHALEYLHDKLLLSTFRKVNAVFPL